MAEKTRLGLYNYLNLGAENESELFLAFEEPLLYILCEY